MPRPSSSSPILPIIIASAATSAAVFVVLSALQPMLRPDIARWFPEVTPSSARSIQVPPPPVQPTARTEDEATIRLVKNAKPAIVAVVVYSDSPKVLSQLDISKEVQPSPLGKSTPQQVGGGSGFFVSEDGILVTNKHVIDLDGAQYKVVTTAGQSYPAKLLGQDPVLDIAFLKVEGSGFPFLTFGDSDAIETGQTVVAIGNAFDEFRNSVTKGVVSGLNRHVTAGDGYSTEYIEEAIQTDAAINPGNSGGPLLDLKGKVIGLNTAVSEQGQLIGFALPSNTVARDADMMKKFGRVVRPFLGVRYQIVTEDLVQQNQLPVDHGALVLRGTQPGELAVSPGSPADKAGIVENDIILEVNGQQVSEDHSLSALLGRSAPGDAITLKIMHAGAQKTVSVVLDELK